MSLSEREFNSGKTRRKYFHGSCYLLFFISIFVVPSLARSQWKRVLDVQPAYGQWFFPTVIYFNQWGVGFIGVRPKSSYSPSIFRSTDNGVTWQEVTCFPKSGMVAGQGISPYDFCFKDSLNGWAATMNGIYVTTNGGFTWSIQLEKLKDNPAGPLSVSYDQGTKLVMCGDWNGNGILSSSDNGKTWQSSSGSQLFDPYNGFAFESDSVGIVVRLSASHVGQLFRTIDGGNTWHYQGGPHSNFECWQPLAQKGTFYAVQDYGPNVLRSTDSGVDWEDVFDFDTSGQQNLLTGCIAADSTGDLFIQTGGLDLLQPDNRPGNGLFMSSDSGKSWISICGPTGSLDTRFCVYRNKIFAMDYESVAEIFVQFNTYTNGRVWMLDLSAPWRVHLDSSLAITGWNCKMSDSVFHFGSSYPCFDAVTLDSVNVVGSSAFSAHSESYQQSGIGGSDSIIVQYQSQNNFDTATLIFHLRVNGVQKDTSVLIYGIGAQPSSGKITIDSVLTIQDSDCAVASKAFHFSSTFPCFNSVTLDSVRVEGSSAFTVASQLYQQNGIGASDSILVQYQSQNPYDTASLVFHFRVNGIQHDSSITIYGIGGAPVAVSLYLKPAILTARAGDTIDIPVYMDGNTTLSGVTLATASLALNSQVITPIAFIPTLAGVSLAGPLSYSGGTGTGGTETVPLQINNLQLSGETMIGSLRCMVYLNDSLQTSVSLASASISSDDPRCLALSTSSDAVTIALTGCGDSTLLRFMQTGSPFTIESIVPNPARSSLRVEGKGQRVEAELDDELGRNILEPTLYALPFTLDVKSIPSGVYYLRLSQDGFVQTRRVVIER
jgi:photosystem II stability/assembly factor-like uncharacterized protein